MQLDAAILGRACANAFGFQGHLQDVEGVVSPEFRTLYYKQKFAVYGNLWTRFGAVEWRCGSSALGIHEFRVVRGDNFTHPGAISVASRGTARHPPSVHELDFLVGVFALKQAVQMLWCDAQVADCKVSGQAFAGTTRYNRGTVGGVKAGAAFPQAGLSQIDEGAVHESEFTQAGSLIVLGELPELLPTVVRLGVKVCFGLGCIAYGAEVCGAVLRIDLGRLVFVAVQ